MATTQPKAFQDFIMKQNRLVEEKKWLVTPVKKFSRTVTNVLATAENYSEVGRLESAKSVVETIREVDEADWELMKHFM